MLPALFGFSERPWRVFAWIHSGSLLAPVRRSLHRYKWLTDPRYEQVILPDVTENPIYNSSTNDVLERCCRR